MAPAARVRDAGPLTIAAFGLSDIFDLEAHVFDHPMSFGAVLARSGEIAVHEDRVGGIERQRLEGPEVNFSAASDPKLLGRIGEAKEAASGISAASVHGALRKAFLEWGAKN
jgi:hypothetical protein